jgi:hypothetical protein
MALKIEEFLRRISPALDLNKIPYMVTGSVASSIHRLDWPYIEKWVAELQLQQQLDQALRATLP